MSIRYDDHNVAHCSLSRCRSVQATNSRPSFSFDDVCFEPVTIIYVYNGDLFVFNEVCTFHKVFVKCEASHIVQVSFCDDGTVEYVEIADAGTLQPLSEWDGNTSLVALVAAFLGEVRLIDNMILNN